MIIRPKSDGLKLTLKASIHRSNCCMQLMDKCCCKPNELWCYTIQVGFGCVSKKYNLICMQQLDSCMLDLRTAVLLCIYVGGYIQ